MTLGFFICHMRSSPREGLWEGPQTTCMKRSAHHIHVHWLSEWPGVAGVVEEAETRAHDLWEPPGGHTDSARGLGGLRCQGELWLSLKSGSPVLQAMELGKKIRGREPLGADSYRPTSAGFYH